MTSPCVCAMDILDLCFTSSTIECSCYFFLLWYDTWKLFSTFSHRRNSVERTHYCTRLQPSTGLLVTVLILLRPPLSFMSLLLYRVTHGEFKFSLASLQRKCEDPLPCRWLLMIYYEIPTARQLIDWITGWTICGLDLGENNVSRLQVLFFWIVQESAKDY